MKKERWAKEENLSLIAFTIFPDFFRNKIGNVVVVVVDVVVVDVVVDVGLMGFEIKKWNRAFTVSLYVLKSCFTHLITK